MDSFQFWLYVIIGVVYLISRVRKKQAASSGESPEKNRQGQPERTAVPSKSAAPKTFSFEELLREITESKVQPKQEPVVDYDDDLEEEEQNLEDVDYDSRKDSTIYETYEKAKKQAFFRPSLEETMKVGDTVVESGRFKEFEKVKARNLAQVSLKDLMTPGSMKKAIVLSEILKPKF